MNEPGVLVYVDKPMAVAIAAKLIGVLRTATHNTKNAVSLNWLVGASTEAGDSNSDQTDLREMLPEVLMYMLYQKIPSRGLSLEETVSKFVLGATGSLIPGDVVSTKGKMEFPGLEKVPEFSPEMDSRVELPLKARFFHGEACVLAFLTDGAYRLPVYVPETSKYQLAFCHEQPVEVTGVVRWVPPYSPGGARALGLALRCAAVWLR
jgi:hypothetical protein